MAIDYDDLYRLCEEFQQLKGAQLQSVARILDLTLTLDFRVRGETRQLIIDLTPSFPKVYVRPFRPASSKLGPTPITNFLKAHFLGARIGQIEIAQKPNRTVVFQFLNGDKESLLTLKCFPHGQQIILSSQAKTVVFPKRPKDTEPVCYIETESAVGWTLNDKFSSRQDPQEKEDPSKLGRRKLEAKLRKAIAALEDLEAQNPELEKIRVLEKEADALKNKSGRTGGRFEAIFSEIKKLRRKKILRSQRKNELAERLRRIDEVAFVPVNAKVKRERPFKGTTIQLSPHWQLWVGRSAQQNDELVRLGAPHDIWIHLRNYPGAHGLLRGPKKATPTQQDIEFACRVVAQFSQSKKSRFAENEFLEFIVVAKKFVKKRKGMAVGMVSVERESVRRIAFKNVKFDVVSNTLSS